MRNIICVLLLCIGFTAATAQEVYTSSGKPGYQKKTKKKKGYDPDKLIIGGGLNAGFGGGYSNFGIAPIVGYRLADHFSAGIGLGYQYYKAPDYSIQDPMDPDKTFYVNESIVYPSLWARYFVFRNIFLDANFEYDFITVKQYDYYLDPNQNYDPILVQDKIHVQVPCMLLGIGVKQPLGGRVSFLGEIMYDALQQKYSPYFGQPVLRLGIVAGI